MVMESKITGRQSGSWGKQCLSIYVLASETTDYLTTEQYGNCNAFSVKTRLGIFSRGRHSHFCNKLKLICIILCIEYSLTFLICCFFFI